MLKKRVAKKKTTKKKVVKVAEELSVDLGKEIGKITHYFL